MKEHKGTNFIIYGVISIFLILLAIPVAITVAGGVLQPEALSITATRYFVTETALAEIEMTRDVSGGSQWVAETIPPEELEDMGIDGDTQEVGLGITATATLQLGPLTGSSPVEMSIHRCPYFDPSYATGENFPANTTFTVLGWNQDADFNLYFLIEDDPTQPQVWIKVTEEVTMTGEYQVAFPRAVACRETISDSTAIPTTAVAAPVDTAPTATIALPQISTATPPPPQPVTLEITNEEATESIREEVPELEDPEVEFNEDGLEITGVVQLEGPLGRDIDGDLEVEGELEQVEADLLINVTHVEVRGQDITDDEEGQMIENLLNNWMRQLLIRRDVQSYELGDGILIINALERQESIFPTLVPSATPEGTLPSTATLTSATATIIPPQAHPITPTPAEGAFTPGDTSITSEEASSAAAIEGVSNTDIQFTDEGMEISGEATLEDSALGFMDVVGELAASGQLEVVDGRLQISLGDVTIAGQELGSNDATEVLEAAINAWLATITPDNILSFEIVDGVLNLVTGQ